MIHEKKLLVVLAAGLVSAALVLGALLLIVHHAPAPGDRLPRVVADSAAPAVRSAWREVAGLPVAGVKELHGLAAGQNGEIQVAADSQWLTLNAAGSVTARTELAAAANAIAVASDGTVYLGFVSHVELYGPDRARLAVWGSADPDSYITSIAVGADDVFVADAGVRIVWRYDRQGRLRNRIGERDPTQKIPGFVVPSPYFDVALAPDGTVWAVNPGRHELENFSPAGRLLTAWTREAVGIDGFVGCCNPSHLAVLPDGSLVTSEKGLPRVKQYTADGRFVGVMAGEAQFAAGTVGLDVAIGGPDRVLVLDPKRVCVRVFVRQQG